jgi:hypothetical protein
MDPTLRRAALAGPAPASAWHAPCVGESERLRQARFFRIMRIEEHCHENLVIEDLSIEHISSSNQATFIRSLSREEMKLVQGGRAISVLIDGRPGGVVDDFDLNMRIFSGDIGVRVV